MTVSKPLGLGLVGCGSFGRFALAAVADLSGVDVCRESVRAGVADLVAAIRTRPADGLEAYESLATAIPAQKAADSGRMQELHQLHRTGVV